MAAEEINFLIDSQTMRLKEDFNLQPITASEIEFYLPGATESGKLDSFWQALQEACEHQTIRLMNTGAETGKDQFEISLRTYSEPKMVVAHTESLKSLIHSLSAEAGFAASFAAKPFTDQPGSGLHLHVSLIGPDGKNTFFKDDYDISPTLKHSIGGLITWVADCMAVFAPTAESYARFIPRSNAPLTASWGANNRTTAIRLPDAAHDDKHIELRTCGADAAPGLAMAVLLAAIHYGLKHKSDPGPQTYGDATLPTSALPKLPLTLAEAQSRLQKSQVILEYFTAPMLMKHL